jgi:hypothetical protein
VWATCAWCQNVSDFRELNEKLLFADSHPRSGSLQLVKSATGGPKKHGHVRKAARRMVEQVQAPQSAAKHAARVDIMRHKQGGRNRPLLAGVVAAAAAKEPLSK